MCYPSWLVYISWFDDCCPEWKLDNNKHVEFRSRPVPWMNAKRGSANNIMSSIDTRRSLQVIIVCHQLCGGSFAPRLKSQLSKAELHCNWSHVNHTKLLFDTNYNTNFFLLWLKMTTIYIRDCETFAAPTQEQFITIFGSACIQNIFRAFTKYIYW